jgi:hypothetical protein
MSILGNFGISGNSGKDKLGNDIPKDGIGKSNDGNGGRGGTAIADIFGIPGIFGRLGVGISGNFGNSGSSGIDRLGSDSPRGGIGKFGDGKSGIGGIVIADIFASIPIPFIDIFGIPGILGIAGISICGNLGSSGSSGKLKLGRLIPKLGTGNSGMGTLKDFSEINLSSL